MAICVEQHQLTISNVGSNSVYIKVDGVAIGSGVSAFLPSATQNETNCTSYIIQTPSAASGVALADALVCSWLVVAVWAVAFYFRIARTGVRGY